MSALQRCPICEGRGVVAYPPGTPAKQGFVSSSTGNWPCPLCEGRMVVAASPDAALPTPPLTDMERATLEVLLTNRTIHSSHYHVLRGLIDRLSGPLVQPTPPTPEPVKSMRQELTKLFVERTGGGGEMRVTCKQLADEVCELLASRSPSASTREALTKLAEAIWRDDIAQPVYFEHVMAWRDREYPAVPSDAPLSEKP